RFLHLLLYSKQKGNRSLAANRAQAAATGLGCAGAPGERCVTAGCKSAHLLRSERSERFPQARSEKTYENRSFGSCAVVLAAGSRGRFTRRASGLAAGNRGRVEADHPGTGFS